LTSASSLSAIGARPFVLPLTHRPCSILWKPVHVAPCSTSLTRASISGSSVPKDSATGSIVSYGARADANWRLAAATSPALIAATNCSTRSTSSSDWP
jgi:hypothetical protein